ncbi:Trypsin 5G1 [Orchesella cincta]|uniref:Trypsin 5G1 n=1 Tax=Orchesella cincta TaxID=48709 RepID=A0A1D2N5T4_ORCCI|nr:Trypsin 5G1 [Orchesella cincta]
MRLTSKLRGSVRLSSLLGIGVTFVLISNFFISSVTAEGNCFVSNCEQDSDPCAELPDKNVAIYKEKCMLMTAYGAEPHEFPHMVNVMDHCGGTLYNRRYVITAAHCVVEAKNGTVGDKTFSYDAPLQDNVNVRIGSNVKTAGEKIKVEKVTVHPYYSRLLENMKTDEEKLQKAKPILYDLAVLKLEKEVEITDTVRTLKLADKGFSAASNSRHSVMLGWGTSDDLKAWFGTYYLQKVNSPIRSDRECPIWEVDPYPKHKDKLICVGGYVDDDYAPTAGPGDSGGPLICKDSLSRAVLCGVASFAGDAKSCAKRIKNGACYPNAFTSISYFHDWIVNITGPQDEKDLYRPIFNGEASTTPNEFPHQVYINSTDGTACGGSLITRDVVLTAGNCVLDARGNFRVDLTIYAGLGSIHTKGNKHVQTFEVDYVHGPPKFRKRWEEWVEENSSMIIADRPHFYDDIILVQLDRPAVETKYVSTISWAIDESEIKEESTEISWKISKSGLPFIQKRKFALLGLQECQDRLDRVRPIRDLPLAPTSICAVEEYSGGSSCDRTVGGPMLCTTKDKRETYICGVQSFRFCSYAFPNVVTNVASMAAWVDDGLLRLQRQREWDVYYGIGSDYDNSPPPNRGLSSPPRQMPPAGLQPPPPERPLSRYRDSYPSYRPQK